MIEFTCNDWSELLRIILLVFHSIIDWSEAFDDVVKGGTLSPAIKTFGDIVSNSIASWVLSPSVVASLSAFPCLIDADVAGSMVIVPLLIHWTAICYHMACHIYMNRLQTLTCNIYFLKRFETDEIIAISMSMNHYMRIIPSPCWWCVITD